MRSRKLTYTCLTLALMLLATGVLVLAASGRSHPSTFVVFETLGYVRIHDSKPADGAKFLVAVTRAAAAGQWKQEAMEGHSLDGHERTEYVFRDHAGNEIRLNWVAKMGSDAVLLVSAVPAVRASATSAIWSNLMPQLTR
jgi:hypothetical protein